MRERELYLITEITPGTWAFGTPTTIVSGFTSRPAADAFAMEYLLRREQMRLELEIMQAQALLSSLESGVTH